MEGTSWRLVREASLCFFILLDCLFCWVNQTYSARRDCCRPVPQMTTSQVVSLSDSMVACVLACWRVLRERRECL